MLSTRVARALAALILSNLAATSAYAADDFKSKNRGYGERFQQRSFYGGNGLPSYIKGVGTYGGSASAIRAPRNGTYVTADGIVTRDTQTKTTFDRPSIVHVHARTMKAACSYEAGVCVIRP